MQRRSENELEMCKVLAEVKPDARSGEDEEEDDDDAEWYRKEVGQDPHRGNTLKLYFSFCSRTSRFLSSYS
jgi:hypothetical protein